MDRTQNQGVVLKPNFARVELETRVGLEAEIIRVGL